MTLGPLILLSLSAWFNFSFIFHPVTLLFYFLCILWTLLEKIEVKDKMIDKDQNPWYVHASRVGWLLSILYIGRASFISGAYTDLDVYRFTGAGMFLAGIIIRYSAMKTLKNFFSYGLKVNKDQHVVNKSLYRHIRHPSYTGMILLSLAIPVIFPSVLGSLFIFISTVPWILLRIEHEETVLIDGLGEEYVDYMKTKKKLIPWIY